MELVQVVKGHKPHLLFTESWIMSGVSHGTWGCTLEFLFIGRFSLKIHLSLCFMDYTQNMESIGVGLVWAAQHRGISLPLLSLC